MKMERMVQELVKAFACSTRKVVSGVTTSRWWKIVLSMGEEFAKRLVDIGPEVLLFGVLKHFLGGTGIPSVAIFILEIIIILRPWEK